MNLKNVLVSLSLHFSPKKVLDKKFCPTVIVITLNRLGVMCVGKEGGRNGSEVYFIVIELLMLPHNLIPFINGVCRALTVSSLGSGEQFHSEKLFH